MRAMNALRAVQEIVERQREELGDRGDGPARLCAIALPFAGGCGQGECGVGGHGLMHWDDGGLEGNRGTL